MTSCGSNKDTKIIDNDVHLVNLITNICLNNEDTKVRKTLIKLINRDNRPEKFDIQYK